MTSEPINKAAAAELAWRFEETPGADGTAYDYIGESMRDGLEGRLLKANEMGLTMKVTVRVNTEYTMGPGTMYDYLGENVRNSLEEQLVAAQKTGVKINVVIEARPV